MTKKTTKTNVVRRKKAKTNLGVLVSDRIQLEDVRLINCNCTQLPIVTHGKKEFSIDHSTEVQADKENGYIVVIAKFHFEAFIETKSQEPVIVIDASFLLAYKIENFEGLTQDAFEQFANLNGIYNAWPYWREFVQNTIVRMGLPSLTIPVFRVVKPPKVIKRKVTKKKVSKKVASRK